MRQWWGMRRLGHTLSSKTQLVANDTTFSARGLGLRLQTRGHNGLNYGLNGYASQSTNKDTHTWALRHTISNPQTQIYCMIGLNLSKALRNVCISKQYAVIKQRDSVVTPNRDCLLMVTTDRLFLMLLTSNIWVLFEKKSGPDFILA